MANQTSSNRFNDEDVISLMAVYREEWQYRDEAFMSHFFKFFSLSFFVIFFPNLAGLINFDDKAVLMQYISPLVFPILGILTALFGVYFSICESSRIVNIDKVYYSLVEQLPDDNLKIKKIRQDTDRNNLSRFFLNIRLNRLLCVMYLFPIFVSIIDIIALTH